MADGWQSDDGWQESYKVMDGGGTNAMRLWTVVGRMMSFGRSGVRLRTSVGGLDSHLLRVMIIRQVPGGK